MVYTLPAWVNNTNPIGGGLGPQINPTNLGQYNTAVNGLDARVTDLEVAGGNTVPGLTWGTGATNVQAAANVTTLNAYLTTLSGTVNGAAGGVARLGKGILKIQGRVSIPAYCGLQGLGSHDVNGATRLYCVDSGSGVDVNGDGGLAVADLTIEGQAIANYPLKVFIGSGRRVEGIDVRGAALDNVTVESAQNMLWTSSVFENAGRHNLVLDLGCGGLDFVQCNTNVAGENSLLVKQSGTSPLVYAQPSHITFHHNLFERSTTDFPVVELNAGYDIVFDNTVVMSSRTTASTTPMMRLNASGVGPIAVRDGHFFISTGATRVGIGLVSGARVVLEGMTHFNGTSFAVDAPSGSTVDMLGARPLLGGGSGWITATTPSSGDQTISYTRKHYESVSKPATTGLVTATAVDGEAGQRFRLTADGKLAWGDGTGFTFPLAISRSSGSKHRFDGTSITATTVGAAGGGSAQPATPVTYLIVNVNGTDYKIALHNT